MTVDHDIQHSRFVVPLPHGEGQLVYALPGDDAIDLQHTEVPPSDQGQGIADALVRAAFTYAREHGLRVIPTCPYVQVWLRRHPRSA
jgi:predicted GNAT family acetyltransferase